MKIKEANMRLIDADELKEKLLKMQDDIVDKKVARGSSKSDAWVVAYLLILDEYIKMLDEMPSMINGCNVDADAIRRAAYVGGFLNGREDALSEVQLIKDYYKNDCDTLNEIWKEQNMKLNMTREETWDKVIQNLKFMDQEAHDEPFVPLITSLLVIIAEELRTNVANGTIKQEDKYQMWSLVDDLGYYSIKGQTIKYLPEYQELTTLMKKVF